MYFGYESALKRNHITLDRNYVYNITMINAKLSVTRINCMNKVYVYIEIYIPQKHEMNFSEYGFIFT